MFDVSICARFLDNKEMQINRIMLSEFSPPQRSWAEPTTKAHYSLV